MEAAVLVACALAAALVVVALVRVARDGDVRLARVALPIGAAGAAVAAAADRWPPTAWALLIPLLVGPAVLASRARTAQAWNLVLAFALAGAVAGYGLLELLLCRAEGGECDSAPAIAAAVAGGAVALPAYGWLYARTLVRR